VTRPLDATIDVVEHPERIGRLLGLLPDGRSYLATWLHLRVTLRETVNDAGEVVPLATPRVEHRTELVVLTREPDGRLKTWGALGDAIPPQWDVRLGYQPPGDRLLSAAGYKRLQVGERPDPAVLFAEVTDVFDRFLDLSFSLGEQRATAELLAVYAMATWLSDAFAAFPYLWPNGDKGSGKTKCLNLVASLSYLGQVILAGGSYAALRDLAEYGATLCFDDAENLADPKTSDPDKRALLLAGNRKGAHVPVKEPHGTNGWRIRNVSAYCPKAFSAIRLPDAVLARRTIVVPLVRSADPERANRDPEELEHWPHDRRRLIDDLWAFGLRYLPAARDAYQAATSTTLTGPGFEPWRPLLATAMVLEAAGVNGLVDRIRRLAATYQREKADFEVPDTTRLVVLAVAELADVLTLADSSDVSERGGEQVVRFTASDVAERVNRLAREEELVSDDGEFTNARRVGRLLDRLRVRRGPRSDRKGSRTREITRLDALRLLRAYGAAGDKDEPDEPADDPADDTPPLSKTSEASENVRTSDEEDVSSDQTPARTQTSVNVQTSGAQVSLDGRGGGRSRCRCGGVLEPSELDGWLRCDRCRQWVRASDPALRRQA